MQLYPSMVCDSSWGVRGTVSFLQRMGFSIEVSDRPLGLSSPHPTQSHDSCTLLGVA